MSILSLEMLSRVWYCICLLLFLLVTEFNGFDLCSSSTENSTEIDSYIWRNQSARNCGCEDCIRRCCKPGYYRLLGTKYCVKNHTGHSFEVPVYTDETIFVKNVKELKNFIVGPIHCEYFNLNYPSEEFYIQIDGSAWVPIFKRYFKNDRYCVDEANGFTPLLCLPPEKLKPNVFGMYQSVVYFFVQLNYVASLAKIPTNHQIVLGSQLQYRTQFEQCMLYNLQ